MNRIENPETVAALREIGCLLEGELNKPVFATLLAQRLEAEHIAHSLADVPAVQATVGQLVGMIIGRSDEQVIELARPLLSAGATSRVQQALTNGYLLCAGRAQIKIDIEGEEKITSIGTRFLSDDEDVLARYVLKPRQDRADSYIKSTLALTQLVERRQPSMAPRIGTFMEQLTIKWELALGSGRKA